MKKSFESFGITVGIKKQISLFPITFDWGRVECCIPFLTTSEIEFHDYLLASPGRPDMVESGYRPYHGILPHPCKRRLCKLWRKLKMFRRSEKGRSFSSTKKRFTVSWKNFTEFSKEDTYTTNAESRHLSKMSSILSIMSKCTNMGKIYIYIFWWERRE